MVEFSQLLMWGKFQICAAFSFVQPQTFRKTDAKFHWKRKGRFAYMYAEHSVSALVSVCINPQTRFWFVSSSQSCLDFLDARASYDLFDWYWVKIRDPSSHTRVASDLVRFPNPLYEVKWFQVSWRVWIHQIR